MTFSLSLLHPAINAGLNLPCFIFFIMVKAATNRRCRVTHQRLMPAAVYTAADRTAAGGRHGSRDRKRGRLLGGSEAKGDAVRQFRSDRGLDPKLQPGDKIEVPQSFF